MWRTFTTWKCVQHCFLCANKSKLKCIATSKVKMDTYLIVNAVQLGPAMNHSSYCYSWTMMNNFSIQFFASLTTSQFSCCIAWDRLCFQREVPKNASPSPSCASKELQHWNSLGLACTRFHGHGILWGPPGKWNSHMASWLPHAVTSRQPSIGLNAVQRFCQCSQKFHSTGGGFHWFQCCWLLDFAFISMPGAFMYLLMSVTWTH